ncbi:MAG: hypothetical protein PHS57_10155 [Alphaproteobacteria bacterium]|nr:hypothetical protein [Alphaproteobacteria bacterium]
MPPSTHVAPYTSPRPSLVRNLFQSAARIVTGQPFRDAAYYHVTDTTDPGAMAKLHGAAVTHLAKANIAQNAMILSAPNTLAVAAQVSELITNTQRPQKLIIAVNNAGPDRAEGAKDNHRTEFFCAVLDDDSVVCGTSNGYEFSLIKPLITEFYTLTNTNHLDSQFRSLEVLPEHAVLFSSPRERKRMLKKGLLDPMLPSDAIIPDPPKVSWVYEVDNFGNVKFLPSDEAVSVLQHACARQECVAISFNAASIDVEEQTNGSQRLESKTSPFRPVFNAKPVETFFDAPLGSTIVARRSSSVLTNGRNIPMIATLRKNPGETPPLYPTPRVGAKVRVMRPIL